MTDTASSCAACHKTASAATLKRCSRCQAAWYCSTDCQRADFKTHKAGCKARAGAKAAAADDCRKADCGCPVGDDGLPDVFRKRFKVWTRAGAEAKAAAAGSRGITDEEFYEPSPWLADPSRSDMRPHSLTPWTLLNNGTWLHGRPENEVYALLIDSYRLREIEAYEKYLEGEPFSIRAGAKNDVYGFMYYVKLAESRPGLLPPWWSERNRNEVVTLGAGDPPHPYYGLDKLRERHEIAEKHSGIHGCDDIEDQLLMFAELVYKRGPGDEDNIPHMKAAAYLEQ